MAYVPASGRSLTNPTESTRSDGTFSHASTSVTESPRTMSALRSECCLKKAEADLYAYCLVKDVMGGSGETDCRRARLERSS